MKRPQYPGKNVTARRAIHFAIGIGAAALVAAAPQLARADGMTPTSIDLQSVTVTPESMKWTGGAPGDVRVAFVDTSTVAAREVIFQVIGASGAVVQQINDKGTFSPGVRITHHFPVAGVEDGDIVQVAAVRYADGSAWRADGAYIQSASRQSVLSTGSAEPRPGTSEGNAAIVLSATR
jgi:hypothetical protein